MYSVGAGNDKRKNESDPRFSDLFRGPRLVEYL